MSTLKGFAAQGLMIDHGSSSWLLLSTESVYWPRGSATVALGFIIHRLSVLPLSHN